MSRPNRNYRSKLTQSELLSELTYDPDTGIFVRKELKAHESRRTRGLAGTIAGGYVSINVKGEIYRAHRLAWLYMTGAWPDGDIDHIDRNRSNNRWSNLRACTPEENAQNVAIVSRSKNKLALVGAHWCKQIKRWKSSIQVGGKIIRLGTFSTAQDAHAAYLSAKYELHPLSRS